MKGVMGEESSPVINLSVKALAGCLPIFYKKNTVPDKIKDTRVLKRDVSKAFF
jgi:hypothetical protein